MFEIKVTINLQALYLCFIFHEDRCKEGEAFHCDIVKCIPLRLVCDKYRDCQDGSDEMSCKNPDFMSCEQWWEAGYRESRNYIISKSYFLSYLI